MSKKENKILSGIISGMKSLAFPLFSVFISLFVAVFFVMWAKGYAITEYFRALSDLINIIVKGSFGDQTKALDTMIYVTPLLFTGVANAVAFKTGLFNIGTEGQFTLGLLSAAIIGLIPGLSPWIHVPLIILGGILAGGLWAAVPGFLKAKFGTNEVINSIMMNYIALYLVNLIVLRTPIGIPKKSTTPVIKGSAQLLQFSSTSSANIGLIIGLLCAILVFWILSKTVLGYELRAVGTSSLAAEYGGISKAKNIIFAMVISGAIAGLGGAVHLAGFMHSTTDMSGNLGYGFDGISVALLAKNNPIGCIPAAILFGTLDSSSRLLQLNNIPKEIVYLIQAVVIIFVSTDYIIKYFKNKRRKKEVAING
ncbi:hypothetical protein CLROS_007460 [Clostridium felsineum]|uniref:Uncharacterized protein n=2 Tax=Clostridium felsineum TaxID=36839 RepID=A0A1S8LJY7_9CLOT|nr:hypothetical protein CLROS_007460 [Clostridium felsineum]URZ10461.1 hypothetical protein CROST_011710 [Clostridium felsineum]